MTERDYLQKFELETWKRIEFTRKVSFNNISEVTLTENLVFNLYNISQKSSSISIYEAQDEKANGNDLLISIKVNGKYSCFPTQAKIIYPNDKFSKISHKVGSTYQIDNLIKFSNHINGIPLYLLYSFKSSCSKYKNYGASLVNAEYVKAKFYPSSGRKNWKIPTFDDLIPNHAIPISQIDSIRSLQNLSRKIMYREDSKMPICKSKASNWKLITDHNHSIMRTIYNSDYVKENSFRPKYKIQLTNLTDNITQATTQ